jgi:rare lipoprotein A
MKYVYKLILVGFLLGYQGVSAQFNTSFLQEGNASYYAEKFHGRLTASGERFNMFDYTAAHKELPFNTLLKITNLTNGKSVLVRVNDRGPYSHNRIIDLSKKAAQDLEMLDNGTSKVSIEIVETPTKEQLATLTTITSSLKVKPLVVKKPVFVTGNTYSMWGTLKYPEGFGLQIGSYTEIENAKGECRLLIAAGIEDVFIQSGWTSGVRAFRVLVGAYKDKENANPRIEELKKLGYTPFVKKHF